MNNALIKKEEFRWSFRKQGTEVLNICTRLLFLFGFAALTGVSTQALANPTGGSVVGGSANISSSGTTETIKQSSQSAIINWNTFNIAKGETTQFLQPNASATALNRVFNNGELSYINGNLTANGHIIIINPNGVVLGKTGNVNTSGFIATSADIANSAFMNNSTGIYNFNIAGNPNASIVNQGNITVADTGLVALVAPTVRNDGVISGNLSKVQLGAADTFGVDLYGDGLVSLAVGSDTASRTLTAENNGSIITPGGQVFMTAAAASGLVNSVINNTGVIEAQTLGDTNGEIALSGAGANVTVSGTLDVSGANGAGNIKVGGDAEGAGTLAHAANTTVTSTGVLNASATDNGNGGKIVVWSDNSTNFQGAASATGGANGGNGGNIETSSANYLNAAGSVNVAAPKGVAGEWLLDPNSIDVTSGSGSTFIGGNSSTGTSNLNVTTLENALYTGNVIIKTSGNGVGNGDISIDAPINSTVHITNLTLDATGSININQAITETGSFLWQPNTMGVTMLAGNAININAVIKSDGGNVTALAANNITVDAAINTLGATGNITLTSTAGQVISNSAGTLTTGPNGSDLPLAGLGCVGPGNIIITGKTGVNMAGAITGGENDIIITGPTVTVGNVTNETHNVNITATNGNLKAGNITTTGADINLSSTNGSITAGNVATTTGDILVAAHNGSINTGNVTVNSGPSNIFGVAPVGTIALTTTVGGNITTGSLSVSNQSGGYSTLDISSSGSLTVNGNITAYNLDAPGGVYAANAPVVISANGNINVTGGIAVSALDPVTCCVASDASLSVTSANGNIQLGDNAGTSVLVQSLGVVNGSSGGPAFAKATATTLADIIANNGSITMSGGVTATSSAQSTSAECNATAAATTNVNISAKNGAVTVAKNGINVSAVAVNSSPDRDPSQATANLTVKAGGTISLNGAVAATSDVSSPNVLSANNSTANVDIESTGGELYFSQAPVSHAYDSQNATGAQETDAYNGINYNQTASANSTYASSRAADIPGGYWFNPSTGAVTGANRLDPIFSPGGGFTSYAWWNLRIYVPAAATAAKVDVANLTLSGLHTVAVQDNETKTYGTNDTTAVGTVSAKFNYIDPLNASFDNTGNASAYIGSINPTVERTVSSAADEQVGTYDITLGNMPATVTGTGGKFALTTAAGSSLTIDPATLTVSASNENKAYGTNDPTLGYTSTGLVNATVDGIALNDTMTATTSRAGYGTLAGEQVGSYGVTVSNVSTTALNAADYNINVAANSGTLTITPATLTVSATGGTKTYGTSDPTLGYTSAGLVNTTVDGVLINDSVNGNLSRADYGTLAGEQVGSHAITLGGVTTTALNAADYTITLAPNSAALTITPASLTVSAADASKTYGTNDPTLGYTSNGLVNKTVDGVVISDNITGNISRAGYGSLAGEQVGNYAITTGNVGTTALNAADYNISVAANSGTLTITPASLTVSSAGGTKTYGTNDPTLAYTTTGLVANKTVDGVVINDSASGSISRADYGSLAGEQVGSYAITTGNVTTTALNAADYNISVAANSGTLTITPASLAVSAADASKTYGTNDPTAAFSSAGLVNTTVDGGVVINDSITGNLSRAGYGTLAGEQVGSYNFTVGNVGTTAQKAADYNISVAANSGTLTITPASLAVSAADASKTYGTNDPTAAFSSAGLVNTTVDGGVVINDSITGNLSRAGYGTLAGEQVGSYNFTVGNVGTAAQKAADYNISVAANSGTLTITPASLTVSATDASKTYGTNDPTLAYTTNGLVNTTVDGVLINDSVNGNVSRAGYGTLAGEQVGSYGITLGGVTTTAQKAADYNITVAADSGSLTINPASLTVSSAGGTKTYGTNDPTLTYTTAGLVNTTVDGVLINDSANGSLSRSGYSSLAGEQVGSYALTTGSIATTALNAADYNISVAANSGVLTITPASLTVSSAGGTKTYGTNDPTLTYTTAGLVNTTVDGVVISDNVNGSLSRADYGSLAGEQVGSYALTTGNVTTTALNAADYNISVAANSGALTITPASLTVSAADASKTYGTNDPTAAFSATGLVNTTVDGVLISDSATGTLSRTGYGTVAGEQVGSYGFTLGNVGTTAQKASDYNITVATDSGTLTINPATLTVTADAGQSKTYGSNDPTLTYASSGLVANTVVDGVTLNDSISGGLSRAQYGTVAGEQVGNYNITLGNIGTSATNDYNVILAPNGAALTINPASLTITANSGGGNGDNGGNGGPTKTYGTNDPTLAYNAGGLVNGLVDGVQINDTITGNLSRADYGTLAGEQVGSYAINIGNIGTTASNAADYKVTLIQNGATLTITPATLTVAANNSNVSKTYGTSDPTMGYTTSGLVNTTVDGVVISDTATGTLSRADYGTLAGEQVGSYAVNIGSLGTTASNANDYNIAFTSNNASLTINPATLTVAANGQTITQGQTVPAGTVSYSGFVNGVTVDGVTINDSTASLTQQATVTSAKSGTPAAGTYASNYTASGAADPNYVFTYTAGNLVVNAGAPGNNQTTSFGIQNTQFDALGRPIVSVADQAINYYAPFQPRTTNPENVNVSIRGGESGGQQGAANLANIEPAAGGNGNQSPEGLANIEPAAGGNGPRQDGRGDFSCARDFLDGKNCTEQ